LSTKNIVKIKRRKSQTSQDKAVATNQDSHQTSGKNQNREYFTIHFHNFFHCFLGNGFNANCLENFNPESIRGSGASK
jgi:hypothetical protein